MKVSTQRTKVCQNNDLKHGVYIIGAGSFSRVIVEFLKEENINVLGFFDDSPEQSSKQFNKAIHPTKDIIELVPRGACFIIAIGNGKIRRDYVAFLHKSGFKTPTYIAKSAYVSSSVKVGVGVLVLPYCVLLNEAEIGDGCILNVSSLIDHDVKIGEYSHINVKSCISNYKVLPAFYQCMPGEVIC